MFAAKHCDVGTFMRLLPAMNIDHQDDKGRTALMFAAYGGHQGIVEALLHRRVNVDQQDQQGWSALIIAARYGHLNVVNALRTAGADVNRRTTHQGRTALMYAASAGHMEIVKKLAMSAARAALQERDLWTALVYAASIGHREMAKSLSPAHTSAQAMTQIQKVKTMLMVAVRDGNVHEAENAVDIAVACRHTDWVLELLEATCNNLRRPQLISDLLIEHALASAMADHQDDMVNSVLCAFRYNHAAEQDPLISAAERGFETSVQAVLMHRPDIDINHRDAHGRTALIEATRFNWTETVRVLLIHPGIDLNLQDADDKTALMIAIENKNMAAAKALLEAAIAVPTKH